MGRGGHKRRSVVLTGDGDDYFQRPMNEMADKSRKQKT